MNTHRKLLCTAAMASVFATGALADGHGWSLEEAAAPYAGTTVDVVFLLRPGYDAIEAMLPEFEEATGINVNIISHPYENALGEQVRELTEDSPARRALGQIDRFHEWHQIDASGLQNRAA